MMMALLGIPAMASIHNPENYLVTNDGKVYFSNVSFGVFNIRITNDNGQTEKVGYSEVMSYKKGNRLFEKKDLYVNNRNTGKKVFMELIRQDNGLRLYTYNGDGPAACSKHSAFSEPVQACKFFVYKGDQYLLQLNEKNRSTVLDFFSK